MSRCKYSCSGQTFYSLALSTLAWRNIFLSVVLNFFCCCSSSPVLLHSAHRLPDLLLWLQWLRVSVNLLFLLPPHAAGLPCSVNNEVPASEAYLNWEFLLGLFFSHSLVVKGVVEISLWTIFIFKFEVWELSAISRVPVRLFRSGSALMTSMINTVVNLLFTEDFLFVFFYISFFCISYLSLIVVKYEISASH